MQEAYQWVIDNISPIPEAEFYPDRWQLPYYTLERKKGDCEDFSFLLASLLVFHRIDTKVVLGKYRGVGHAWVEISLKDGGFQVLDSALKVNFSYKTETTRRNQGYEASCDVYPDSCRSIIPRGCERYVQYPKRALISRRADGKLFSLPLFPIAVAVMGVAFGLWLLSQILGSQSRMGR
jgi:hypothetical protein